MLSFASVVLVSFYASSCSAYIIDPSPGLGRQFDGIGGLSGGGATSKLLINYPEAQRNEILDYLFKSTKLLISYAENQRNEILDYLFKPNFGASLHILKVEIGGDAQSTDGTESSHMHEPWDENYERGYEWWLMTEAKKRNPNIKLYGLPWTFPGWIGRGGQNPYAYPNDTANYIMKWVVGAQKYYNSTIDYIGVWNERNYNITYVETLSSLLKQNAATAHVQLVVSDSGWDVSNDILKDPKFAATVDVIGVHYPGTTSTDAAVRTGKPLWSSEDYSTYNDNVGSGCWARILNQNYVNGLMTSTISWNIIASYYDALPFARDGLMTAIEPWSGHYEVSNPIWISAHTTQFTQIGWKYLQHGAGVQKLDKGGSMVTLISPDMEDITIVIETMTHDHSVCIRPGLPPYTVVAQQAEFALKGSLSQINRLYVWKTHFNFSGGPSTVFEPQEPITPYLGMFTLLLYPDEVYTLTTLPSGHRGSFGAVPESKPFPVPYSDNFDDYPEYAEASNYAPQIGVWEVRQSNDPAHGKVNRQVVLRDPIYWCDQRGQSTLNVGGDYNWADVRVQMDVLIPMVNGTSGAFIAARVDQGGCGAPNSNGVFFSLFAKSGTFIVSSDIDRKNLLVNGSCSVTYDTWYTVRLMLKGDQAYGFLGTDRLFTVTVPSSIKRGFTGYGTASYGLADFDNWSVDSTASSPELFLENSKWHDRL